MSLRLNFCVNGNLEGQLLPRQLMCVIGTLQKVPMKAPELHKRILARKLCVTDVLSWRN